MFVCVQSSIYKCSYQLKKWESDACQNESKKYIHILIYIVNIFSCLHTSVNIYMCLIENGILYLALVLRLFISVTFAKIRRVFLKMFLYQLYHTEFLLKTHFSQIYMMVKFPFSCHKLRIAFLGKSSKEHLSIEFIDIYYPKYKISTL